ncbi:hypothetical protein ABMA27_000108 [Loxostege sticticalis]|uniref:cGMP-dependent protein kinase interacting domain-containing protein n=1 Tax=Loxostege sticticalis TaxID=481309 RepID=A0ABR3IMD0_LOXSC
MEEMLQKAIDEKGVDCEKSRNAEVDTLMSDAKNWAANGYVEVRDPKTGGTPLHVAAAKGYIDVAKTLLEECNAEPDCVDYEGWTPLHAAALWGQKEAAALLLKFGADPHLNNYSGQTCLDLADPSISAWLSEAVMKLPRRINNNNNNNKRKRSPPKQYDAKRVVELHITGQDTVNDKPAAPEIIPKVADGKPPKGRAPSPDHAEPEPAEEAPSWRRSASFRRQQEPPRDNNKPVNNTVDNDTILRRTHSFENDKTFYQRYRDVTARIKASSCPSIPPLPQAALAAIELRKKETNNTESTNEDVQTRINPSERREREANTWTAPTTTTAANSTTNTTTTTSQTTVRRSFVPPVRDEESETQRKAHAKRVRETRRSTQGVTLDEIKSAEQLVKKKAGNGTTESPSPASVKKSEDTPAPASNDNGSFELEDAGRASPRASAPATEATVTLPLRRPPAGSTANTTASPAADEREKGDEEKERESSSESKSSSASPASTQAALNVIQRRRRPKRRSTGVGHVDMDDIVNDRGGGGEGDGDTETVQSGSERTEEGEERDYKALYEASSGEVRRLRALLNTSEQQLREARATITRLTQVNQNSLSEIEKREKRAMERKLSEMEEELKQLQKLKAENERLRAENRALTRVVSKLTNSAAK